MKQRIQTAVIALIVFIPIVIYGNLPFSILIYLLATIGLIELMKMHKIPIVSVPSFLAIGLVWLIILPQTSEAFMWFNKTQFIMIFVMLLLSYTVLVKNKFTFDDTGFILLAALYVGTGFLFFHETRLENGLAPIFYVLLVVWATDTGAYFSGRSFGKRKLWPQISPNKTIEGAIGGILLAMVVGVIYHLIFPMSYTIGIIIIVSILVSIFGQIGDLVESAFKRHYDVKDSGNLLPGHGGILDRFDSLLFVFPMLHFIYFF
ncbi:phosphatidate cytidylyltransferase [Ornithinibacillus sp. L9]|uniref:Phosphatidate cytidylyltransferase n=1 Tax=Ornithinibacillus caprae TaxID=2678566 RepID=A0A6N8FL58_9BACI|nr:phosphatidate cytidylyltransferase [Ornithinibacillus caprae]MUK89881.1 phosphatidate cytidylyltransferase [Ornithinibacillus caprae]